MLEKKFVMSVLIKYWNSSIEAFNSLKKSSSFQSHLLSSVSLVLSSAFGGMEKSIGHQYLQGLYQTSRAYLNPVPTLWNISRSSAMLAKNSGAI